MQLFSADAIVFSKKFSKLFFIPKKWKNGPQKLLIIGFFPHSLARATAHSPELFFQIMKSQDQASVLLSVMWPLDKTAVICIFNAIKLRLGHWLSIWKFTRFRLMVIEKIEEKIEHVIL